MNSQCPPKNGHQIASTLPTCTPEVCTSPLCEEDSQVLRCPRSKVQIYQSHSMMCFFVQIFVPLYIPEPSKGCQMVPKGCQFTIPYRVFVGTPFKVLVCSIYIYFNLTSWQRFEKRVTPGTKCSHMECYYSWKSCFAKSSSFSVASPLFVKSKHQLLPSDPLIPGMEVTIHPW